MLIPNDDTTHIDYNEILWNLRAITTSFKNSKVYYSWLYRPNGLLIRKFEQHYYYNELVLRKPLVMS
ncbi:unnamed protein product [Rhizophagus irregularis]|nr:unnamed protein product [Rhizophagus irregularis]